jgi:hypothetical protein
MRRTPSDPSSNTGTDEEARTWMTRRPSRGRSEYPAPRVTARATAPGCKTSAARVCWLSDVPSSGADSSGQSSASAGLPQCHGAPWSRPRGGPGSCVGVVHLLQIGLVRGLYCAGHGRSEMSPLRHGCLP